MIIHYIEYDPNTGEIYTSGYCEKSVFPPPTNRDGGVIIEVKEYINIHNTVYDLKSKTFKEKPVNTELDLNKIKLLILHDLQFSDYTQANDAMEHMDPADIDAWRKYRKSLRSAYNLADGNDMLNALPNTNPKGIDMYQRFRTQNQY